MDLKKFSKKNRERCESPDGFNHKLNDWSLSDWMTALVGEVGEAANIVKKLNRCRDGIPGNDVSQEELEHQLAMELADIDIYLDLLYQRIGEDRVDCIKRVFNSKSHKLGCSIKV